METRSLSILSEKFLKILFGRGNRPDIIILDENIQHVGRDKRRKGGAEQDILDPKMKERQQNADRLLFVPRQNHRKRKVVHTAAERFRESDGDFDRAVSVVALTHIHNAGQTAYRTEVEVVETILSAGEGQNYRVGRGLLYKFGVIVSSRPRSVASSDEEEALDRSAIYRLDHGIRNR